MNKTIENICLKLWQVTNAIEMSIFILMAYRSSMHETTGQTPNCTLFGQALRLPYDLSGKLNGSKLGEKIYQVRIT